MISQLRLAPPRLITTLHQIELSSKCQLKCVYCPSPTMKRPQGFMAREHFLAALDWVRLFVRRWTQGELNLAGTGESTLHPDFPEFIGLARAALGPVQALLFPTNGIALTEEIVEACVRHDCRVYVSLHQGSRAGMPAIQLAKRRGVLAGYSVDAAVQPTDWAGQVKDWPVSFTEETRCPWIREGWCMVLSDGRLTTCSFDAEGAGVVGLVTDAPGSLSVAPYSLCASCHQQIGVIGHEQWGPAGMPRHLLPIVPG